MIRGWNIERTVQPRRKNSLLLQKLYIYVRNTVLKFSKKFPCPCLFSGTLPRYPVPFINFSRGGAQSRKSRGLAKTSSQTIFCNLVKKGGGGQEVMRGYLVKENVFNSGWLLTSFNNFIFQQLYYLSRYSHSDLSWA